MSQEVLGGSPAINPELQFASVEAIEKVREAQASTLIEAVHPIIKTGFETGHVDEDALSNVRDEVNTNFSAQLSDLVSKNIDQTRQLEKFNILTNALHSFSEDNMSSEKWFLGDIQEDGEHDYTTSGRYQLEQLLISLSAEPEEPVDPTDPEEPDDHDHDGDDDDHEQNPDADLPDPVDHESPEVEALYEALGNARKALAEASVARRRATRGKGKSAEKLAVAYDEAKTAYDAAYSNVTTMYITAYRGQGRSEQGIREKMLPRIINEHHDFTEAELEVLKSDNSLRGRAARFLAKRGSWLGFSIGSGVGVGLGVRAISKTALAVGAGITGGALVAGGIAARTGKNILLAKVTNQTLLNKTFDKRRNQDKKDLEKRLSGIASTLPVEQAITAAHGEAGKVITSRTEKDPRSNRRRILIGAIIGGVAAGATELGPEGWHDIFGGGSHHAASPINTTTSTAPVEKLNNGFVVDPNKYPGLDLYTYLNGPVPAAHSGLVDGFQPHVLIEHGHGYENEFHDLAEQKGIDMTPQQTADAYHDVLGHQGDANFFHGDKTYNVGTDHRISHPGYDEWRASSIRDFNHWLIANHLEDEYGAAA